MTKVKDFGILFIRHTDCFKFCNVKSSGIWKFYFMDILYVLSFELMKV